MKNSRKLAILMTILITAIFLTAITFAWQQMSSIVNEFVGEKKNVTLRDDFDPKTGLKDVYIENNGHAAVFVRIKLNEAMNIVDKTWRPDNDNDNDNDNDWITHIYGRIITDCLQGNANGDLFHDYFIWEMGGEKYYKHSDGSLPIVQDAAKYDGTEQGVKKTPYAEVITVAAYLGMSPAQQEIFAGWICDTDGYAYWSQPLEPGEATGLLLHRIIAAESMKNADYYYAIDVILEAVDKKDIPMWTQGAESIDGSGTKYAEATEDGKKVINKIILSGA